MDPLEAVQFVTSRGTLPEGQTLGDVVGAERYAKVAKLASALEVPELVISQLEPWAAAMVLTQFALDQDRLRPAARHRHAARRSRARRRQAGRRARDRRSTSSASSTRAASRSRRASCSIPPTTCRSSPTTCKRLIAAWRARRPAGAREGARQGTRARARALRRVVRRAQPQVAAEDRGAARRATRTYLVVVGALHFVGQDGLLELLEARRPQARFRSKHCSAMRSFRDLPRPDRARTAGIAVLGYPAWELTQALGFDLKFHRVASRIAMLTLLVGFLLRRAPAQGRRPRQPRLRRCRAENSCASLGGGLLLGAVTMLPVLATMVLLDMRDLRPEFAPTAGHWLKLALTGRGHRTRRRAHRGDFPARRDDDRHRARVGVPQGDRAHVAGVRSDAFHRPLPGRARRRGRRQRVRHAGRRFRELRATSASSSMPSCASRASASCWAWCAQRTGNIAACIGLHAGWVAVIFMVRETSMRNPSGPATWLLSDYDGFIGWMVLAWIVVLGFVLARIYKPAALTPVPAR